MTRSWTHRLSQMSLVFWCIALWCPLHPSPLVAAQPMTNPDIHATLASRLEVSALGGLSVLYPWFYTTVPSLGPSPVSYTHPGLELGVWMTPNTLLVMGFSIQNVNALEGRYHSAAVSVGMDRFLPKIGEAGDTFFGLGAGVMLSELDAYDVDSVTAPFLNARGGKRWWLSPETSFRVQTGLGISYLNNVLLPTAELRVGISMLL